MVLAVQRSFADLGTPLVDTTFCVLDLETTGGGAGARITEVGAVKVRGGDVLGEFQTLVNPLVPIPTFISMLTGITDAMVAPSPPISSVLPAFLEFLGDAVIVAHNAGFDTRFLRDGAAALGYAAPTNPVVCTVRLARRLVRDEVPNLQLATLAQALHATTAPAHRALADARATTDVFHALLELAARWGVTHLDDLLWFQGSRGHPQYRKVRLAEHLPRSRGVYLFRGERGELLYVGKAANLRARVRSYFSSDDRRRIGDLLRALERIEHVECPTDLEAAVVEARLIRAHAPPFNRAGRGRSRARSLGLTRERFPRLVVGRAGGGWDGAGLGPLAGPAADAVREALEEAGGVRTCSARIGRATRFPACVLGEIGRCPAPCEGRASPEDYEARLAPVRAALGGDPTPAVAALERRMERLSGQARFEEACLTRDRIGALVEVARRARSVQALVRAGRVRIEIDGRAIDIRAGVVEAGGGRPLAVPGDGHADEPRLVAAWLARNNLRVRLIAAEGEWTLSVGGAAALERWAARLRQCKVDPS